jgi:hypothetical protein
MKTTTFAFAAAFAGAIAGAAALPGTAEARSIRALLTLEYNAANRDHIRMAEQLQTMRTGQRVELDLRLEVEAAPERVASLGATKGRPLRRSIEIGDEASARLQEVICLTDINAPLNYTKQNYFRMKLFENFEHITLKVYPGDKADFPRNDAACVFEEAAPGKKAFHLRGRYEAIINPTPKGTVVQLRPVK